MRHNGIFHFDVCVWYKVIDHTEVFMWQLLVVMTEQQYRRRWFECFERGYNV